MASIVERPIAESIEYRPPTQSQKPNMLAVSMPNLDTSDGAEVYDPVKDVFRTAGKLPVARDSHSATLLENGTVLVAEGYTTHFRRRCRSRVVHDVHR